MLAGAVLPVVTGAAAARALGADGLHPRCPLSFHAMYSWHMAVTDTKARVAHFIPPAYHRRQTVGTPAKVKTWDDAAELYRVIQRKCTASVDLLTLGTRQPKILGVGWKLTPARSGLTVRLCRLRPETKVGSRWLPRSLPEAYVCRPSAPHPEPEAYRRALSWAVPADMAGSVRVFPTWRLRWATATQCSEWLRGVKNAGGGYPPPLLPRLPLATEGSAERTVVSRRK